MTEEAITITAQQAATIFTGLAYAVVVVEDRMKLKSAEPFRNALTLEISAYKNEMSRLAQSFPELRA